MLLYACYYKPRFCIDTYLAGFLKTLSPIGPFASNSFLLDAKGPIAIIQIKSVTIAFLSSPPFLLHALSFSPVLFLCYCDFGVSQA